MFLWTFVAMKWYLNNCWWCFYRIIICIAGTGRRTCCSQSCKRGCYEGDCREGTQFVDTLNWACFGATRVQKTSQREGIASPCTSSYSSWESGTFCTSHGQSCQLVRLVRHVNLGDVCRCKPILAFLSKWTDTHGITMQSMISWGCRSCDRDFDFEFSMADALPQNEHLLFVFCSKVTEKLFLFLVQARWSIC